PCAMLLKPGEYQVLLVDAPKVSGDEVRQSIRWSIKDLLDHPIDEVTFDILDIPVIKDDPLANHQMYVVAAPNMLVGERMAQFENAKLSLEAIDIPETAQRNIATLYEEPHHSLALVHVDDDGALLTISFEGELYFTRRIDVTLGALASGLPHDRKASEERLIVELQRSLDHFERQHQLIPISKVVLGPMPDDLDVDKLLAEGLGISIEAADLREVMEFADKTIGPAGQARIFYPLGASLRIAVAAH
ncbi:MAG: agglutinin biogenesis protein MshI, partial [Burkholderiales bacterium]